MTGSVLRDSLQRIQPFTLTLLVAFSVQFALVSYTFPLSELFSATPLLHIDNAMHSYRVQMAVSNAAIGGVMGYDPFFAAGTDYGITGNPGAKMGALMGVLLQPLFSEFVAWKLFTFLSSLIAALCLPIAMRLLQLPQRTIVAVTVLGLLLWWVSMFRWFHTAGLVSYVLASYLALPYLAYLIKYLNEPHRYGPVLVLGLVGAVGTFIHPLFPIPIIFATPLLAMFYWRQFDREKLVSLFVIVPVLALLPNLVWLIPIITEKSFFSPIAITHQSIVDANLIWKELIGIWAGDSHGCKLNPIIALLCGAAYLWTDDPKHRRLVLLFILLGVIAIVYSALGSLFYMAAKWTQPNRFSSLGYLILVVPASIGVHYLIRGFGSWRQTLQGKLNVAVMAMAAIALLLPIYELTKELSYRNIGHYGAVPPEVKQSGPYSNFILNVLKSQTSSDGRVLFETANGRIHDNSHIAGYYAYASDREFIGGPYPFTHFAGYWDGTVFNQPIQDIPLNQFQQYLALYNIGWIVAYSDQSKDYYARLDNVRLLDSFKEIAIYAVDRPLSYFHAGKGIVTHRAHNRMEFKEVSPDKAEDTTTESRIVLRYHYSERLVGDPPLALHPVKLLDDPQPFIEIRQPPGEFTLFVP